MGQSATSAVSQVHPPGDLRRPIHYVNVLHAGFGVVMANPIISVRDLTVSYGGRRVLDGVNLDVERGEVMALIGGSRRLG